MEIVGTAAEQTDNGKHVSLDAEILDKLANSVEKLKVETLCSFSHECSIYRVPKRLRNLKEKAYTPQVISIGPLHRNKEELKGPEEHKKLYLKEFLELSKVSVKEYIAYILEMEARLRNSYAENLEDLKQQQFVEMMLLDCSFVIMFLLKLHFSCIRSRNTDPIFNKPGMSDDIIFDLCLLENQLPFFILEELLEQSKIQHRQEILDDLSKPVNRHQFGQEGSFMRKLFGQEGSFMRKLTYAFLSSIWDMWVPKIIRDWSQIRSSKVDHFVDFLRICQLPDQETQPICQQPAQETQPEEPKDLTAPRVAELRQVGIKFINSRSSKNLFDIKFNYNRGELEIPRLKIDDQTEILCRNLLAFEQWNYAGDKRYANDYITMLHLLVRAAKDVEILVKEGIIDNRLHDSGAVSSLFKNLYKGNPVDRDMENFYFFSLVGDLNKYHKKRRHKWQATLKQKYCYNPCVSISVVAAALLLILTFVQAVCSIIQVI